MTVLTSQVAPAPEAVIDALIRVKRSNRIGVCIPARNEAATIEPIVAAVGALRTVGLVDELVVIDDGSVDDTAARSAAAGASVLASVHGPGKGQALTRAVAAADSDVLVFLDADVTNFTAAFVTRLVAPLLQRPDLQLAKATYRRPLDGRVGEGGRVTELLARPLLRSFFPDLASIAQPLAGECALRRAALDGVVLADGYGIEIGLLIDVFRRHGRAAIVEVDLGERIHRNRPLHQLRRHADDVLAAVLDRIDPKPSTRGALP